MLKPIARIKEYETKYPNCWKTLTKFREPQFINLYPKHTFLPIAAGITLVSNGASLDKLHQMFTKNPSLISDAAILVGLAAWRMTKGVYEFEPTILALVASAEINDVPWTMLERLPEWCIYVPTLGWNSVFGDVQGFFAWNEWNTNTKKPEFRVVAEHGDELGVYCLPHAPTISQSLGALQQSAKTNAAKRFAAQTGNADLDLQDVETSRGYQELLQKILALCLYLCCETPEISNDRGKSPRIPSATKTKKGQVLFPAIQNTVYHVGFNLARQLKEAQNLSLGSGTKKRPHARKPHFSTSHVGPKRQHSILKFINLILVNTESELEQPTVHHVKP